MASYLRVKDAGIWQSRGRFNGHAEIAKEEEKEILISTFKVTNAEGRLRLNRAYTLTLPTKEQWEKNWLEFPEDSLMCYINGSGMAGTGLAGAGSYLKDQEVQESYTLGWKYLPSLQ